MEAIRSGWGEGEVARGAQEGVILRRRTPLLLDTPVCDPDSPLLL